MWSLPTRTLITISQHAHRTFARSHHRCTTLSVQSTSLEMCPMAKDSTSPMAFPEAQAEHLPIAHMAMLVATRVQLPGESIRATVDKVRKRLAYAVAHGELHTTGASPELFYAPEVLAWGRNKWPGKLLDLLARQTETLSDRLVPREKWGGDVISGDLTSCQVALRHALKQIDVLRDHLQKANAEADRLRPLAEKYEASCEKNRRSAKLPRTERRD